ncbi:substrate-binding domain-containing protein [Naasia lichenicola]|uniref:LacI family transcriptional regulator n=1 Tax=Naasia lichenicola TaxID=2565933 RepID=A0A4S4FJA8_9MICO|nr:substrate-binding domain-containing protein [Naasia lichenicola]THG29305.1 LacI family transcriptional regulator [Naasia lichenicola]
MRHSTKHKLSAALVVVTAVGLLAGCSSGGATAGAGGDDSGTKTVVYVPGMTGIAFYETLRKGAEDEAKKQGINFEYQGAAEFTPAAQTPVVDAVCGKKPDLLIISPTDPAALKPAIDRCIAAGIPVITVDTNAADGTKLVSAITSDNEQGGEAAAEFLGEALGGSGEVGVVGLDAAATTDQLRQKGFLAKLTADYPDIKVVANEYAGFDAGQSQTVAKSLKVAHPDLAGLFGIVEPNVEGIAAAVGSDDSVQVIGYDASPAEVDRLKKGEIDALVVQPAAEEGSMAIQFAKAYFDGDTSKIEASLLLKNTVVTTKDADSADSQALFYVQ